MTKHAGGRPSLPDRTTLQIRTTREERAMFEAKAAAVGLTVSEWARIVLRQDCGLWPKTSDSKQST